MRPPRQPVLGQEEGPACAGSPVSGLTMTQAPTLCACRAVIFVCLFLTFELDENGARRGSEKSARLGDPTPICALSAPPGLT